VVWALLLTLAIGPAISQAPDEEEFDLEEFEGPEEEFEDDLQEPPEDELEEPPEVEPEPPLEPLSEPVPTPAPPPDLAPVPSTPARGSGSSAGGGAATDRRPEPPPKPLPPRRRAPPSPSDATEPADPDPAPPRPPARPRLIRRPSTSAAPLPRVPTPEADSLVTESAVRDALQRRAAALQRADFEAADLALQELIETRRTLGIRNIVVAGSWLIREARQAVTAGQTERAVELAQSAARLAPDLPAAHWMLMRSWLAHDPTRVVQITGAASAMMGTWMFSFRNSVTFWAWAGLVLVLTLAFVTLAYAAAQLAKYLRYPAHDLSRRLPGVLGTGELTLVLLVLVAVPMALGFGVWVSVGLALCLVVPYQSTRERWLSAVFGLGLALAPAIIGGAAPFVLFHGSNTDVLASALQETMSSNVRDRLHNLSDDGAEDARLVRALVQAHRARQRGDVEEARQQYGQVLAMDPTDHRSRNNLAVLTFVAGEEEEARRAFEQAVQSDLVEPRLNLSLILADDGQFERADQLLMEARDLDPALTEAFTASDGSRSSAARLMEVPLPDTLLWRRLTQVDSGEREAVVDRLWRPLGGHTPVGWFPMLVVGLALVAAVALRRRQSLSTPCTRCGRPATRDPSAPLCEQCQSVFVSAVAVEPRMRADKEAEVRAYQRRRRFVERALSPFGVGLLLGDRPLTGVVLTFAIAAMVVAVLTLPVLSHSAWHIYVGEEPRQWATYSMVALGLGAVALSMQRSWER
jgi:tetratricopeptide (TPR) repeat protein